MERSGELAIGWLYAAPLFSERTIARMAKHWEVLLQGAVAIPRAHVRNLPLLTDEELRQILGEWNAPGSVPSQ